MIWFGKNKAKKNKDKRGQGCAVQINRSGEIKTGAGKNQGRRLSSEQLRAQALANARAAREAIGEETLQKVAALLQRKQDSTFERAKQQIASAEADRVAEEILSMLETRH